MPTAKSEPATDQYATRKVPFSPDQSCMTKEKSAGKTDREKHTTDAKFTRKQLVLCIGGRDLRYICLKENCPSYRSKEKSMT
jgi:hypothetical protein